MGRIPKIQSFEAVIRGTQTRTVLAAIFAGFVLQGCASTYSHREVDKASVELNQASAEIPESQLLEVRISPFEPGEIPESKEAALGLSKDIRKAEGYYAAVQLKNAMQQSGHWGPVRVVPAAITGGEVIVSGRLHESDGEVLSLEISVRDATGLPWFKRDFQRVVDTEAYDQVENGEVEAFRHLYNRIANDISLHRQEIPPKDVGSIRQVAELKFAREIAPSSFEGFLVEGEPKKAEISFLDLLKSGTEPPAKLNPILSVARLPAAENSMFTRVKRIRAREEMLVDTFDLQYERLAREIADPYTKWRSARLDEMNSVRELEAKRDAKVTQAVVTGVLGTILAVAVVAAGGQSCLGCAGVGGAIAGAALNTAFDMAVKASEEAEENTAIHKAALEELGQSIKADLKLTVVQVEGEMVELKGTATEKFGQWREILTRIHKREVGDL